MKKRIFALCMAFIFLLAAAGMSFADEPEYDTLADWNIKVAVPDNTIATLSSDGNYYIYTQEYNSIPYVMLRVYEGYEDELDFIDGYFTDFMKKQYPDLRITKEAQIVSVGDSGLSFYEIDYEYSIQEYTARDRRLVTNVEGKTYMFASKEVEELGRTVGDLLEEVAATCVFLDADGNEIDLGGGDIEEWDPYVLYWEDVAKEIEEEGLKGEFVTFGETGYEMWIPDILSPGQLPPGQPGADTFIGFYTTETGDAYASVQFVSADITLEQYEELLGTLEEVEDIDHFLINDNPFILYFIPGNDAMCLSTVVEGKGLLEFTFSPIDEGDFGGLAEVMGVSIRKTK